MASLGCLESLDVQIGWQCGTVKCFLSNVISVEFNRILDDTSTATIIVGISGTGEDPCCDCLADVYPYCHEVRIFRNGVLEWIGPIKKVRFSRSQVVIEAEDALAWLKVRTPSGAFDNVGNPMEISDVALQMIKVAFSELNTDPCVLDYVVQTDINLRPTLFSNMEFSKEQFPAFEDSYYSWLIDLTELGLSLTTYGRSILIGAENFNQAALGTLLDSHILGDVEYTRDGDLMANRWYVRYQGDDTDAQCLANCTAGNGGVPCTACVNNNIVPGCYTVPCPAIAETDEDGRYCFNLIERRNSEGIPFNLATAQQAADAYLKASQVAPGVLEFPEGTRLAPETPFSFSDLIAGCRIDVALNQLCTPIRQSFRLLEVTYSLTAQGNEEIGLTLAPINVISTQI